MHSMVDTHPSPSLVLMVLSKNKNADLFVVLGCVYLPSRASGSTCVDLIGLPGVLLRLYIRQASKYRELAGARGVQVAQLETEVSSLKATVKNLRLT